MEDTMINLQTGQIASRKSVIGQMRTMVSSGCLMKICAMHTMSLTFVKLMTKMCFLSPKLKNLLRDTLSSNLRS